MNNTIEEIKYKGFKILIKQDEIPIDYMESFELLGTITCFHKHYDIGHKHNYSNLTNFLNSIANDFDSTLYDKIDHWQSGKGWKYLASKYDLDEAIKISDDMIISATNNILDKYYIMLPVYMYSHSGITINTTGFSCPWDSGQIGYIYVSKKKVKEIYNWKILTKKRIKLIEGYLQDEIKSYDDFLTGNVYGYDIESIKDTNPIECDDSCWGYYGDFKKSNLIEDAKNNIDACIKHHKKEVRERIKIRNLFNSPMNYDA